ncbi:MAG: pimeloyl-ACP methyl ester carboxylesterase/DNA-binding CsgD family transcriptional regulator [Candidatus Azotimanducaceae bacterium]|jgi:pimeloyl-ACP methyl ester carboxylesterase/DNA-binding CsgD family transcriptional regulator
MTKTPLQDQKALTVLQAVYSHQLEKQDFGELLHTLDEAILGLTSSEFEADAIPERLSTLENLEEHFELATRLDFKLSEEDEEREISQLCEGNLSCFAINQHCQILAMSDGCGDRLGEIVNHPIERLPLRNEDIQALRTATRDITSHEVIRQKDRALFVRHSEEEHVAIFHIKHFRKSRVVVVLFDHLIWTKFVEDAVKRNFAFTDAECNVVRLLVEGNRPAKIASDLGRSVETIRSQIKSVQSKTQIRDTTALIRLMCEIMTISANLDVQDKGGDNLDIELPVPFQLMSSTQKYDVTQMVGIEDYSPSRTALFVHGMLQGPFLTTQLRRLLVESKIEMLCPSRPGYGGTPSAKGKEQFIQTSIDQMLHLMDAYKIDKTVLVGHMLGMQFATRLAAYAPDRVSALVSISGVIPMMSKAQLKQQNTMHRMAMLAAKYSPATLGYIAQIGERYLREGNELKCLNQLFAKSVPDRNALKNQEYAALLKGGFQHLIANGKSAFMHDTQSGIDDWQQEFRKISCPCVVLHGVSDAAVPAQSLRAIMSQFKTWDFHFFEDAGQTLLHTHPTEIVEHLNAAMVETQLNALVS